MNGRSIAFTAFILLLSGAPKLVLGCYSSSFRTDYKDKMSNDESVVLEHDDESDRNIADGGLDITGLDAKGLVPMFKEACTNCKKKNLCEHFTREAKFVTHLYAPYVEHFIRGYAITVDIPPDSHDDANATTATCYKWKQEDFDDVREKLNHFNGTAQENQTCDSVKKQNIPPTDICQNFFRCPAWKKAPFYFAAPTNFTCDNITGTCIKAQKRVTWHTQAPTELEKMYDEHDCLTPYGLEKVKGVINDRFNGTGDGIRLHKEDCEANDNAPPEKRCRILSDQARFYFDKSKPSKSCSKVTHLNCDPILKSCLCGYTFNRPEVEFQFANRSEICVVRPTFSKARSISCGGRSYNKSVSKLIPNFDQSICRCRSDENLIYFNSVCSHWWVCRGSRTVSNSMLLVAVAVLIAIMLA